VFSVQLGGAHDPAGVGAHWQHWQATGLTNVVHSTNRRVFVPPTSAANKKEGAEAP
jgi:hypothetical protein